MIDRYAQGRVHLVSMWTVIVDVYSDGWGHACVSLYDRGLRKEVEQNSTCITCKTYDVPLTEPPEYAN